jgi:hypothetical protein
MAAEGLTENPLDWVGSWSREGGIHSLQFLGHRENTTTAMGVWPQRKLQSRFPSRGSLKLEGEPVQRHPLLLSTLNTVASVYEATVKIWESSGIGLRMIPGGLRHKRCFCRGFVTVDLLRA